MSNLARLLAPQARPGDPPMPAMVVQAEGEAYRFKLLYIWKPGAPILPWIMLNPAYAGTRTRFDQTARRVIRFSHRWGFGGALLLNIVPRITPQPGDLRDWLKWDERQDWHARDQLWRNWNVLRDELATHDAAMVAWGASFEAWTRLEAYAFDVMLEQAFDTINDPDGPRAKVLRLFCLGTTGFGRPIHPMARGRHRVADDARPILFTRRPGTIVSLGEPVAGPAA